MTSSRASSLPSSPYISNINTPTLASDQTPTDSGHDDETEPTHCEFDVDWENIWHSSKRLVGVRFRPRHRRTVGTKIKESWVYQHGASLDHNGSRYWLCKICHLKKSYKTALYTASGTHHIANHLSRAHRITEQGQIQQQVHNPFTVAALRMSSNPTLSRQSSYQVATPFNAETWKARFVDWCILEDVTFRQASSDRLQWLIAKGGELAGELCPTHHSTVSTWIKDSFQKRERKVINLIQASKSVIHLSFDIWTASNGVNYVAIVGHFVDRDGKKRDALLGLPRLVGPHSGENIAGYIKDVINRYELGSRLGYFMMDNADNNDTCLTTLATWFPIDTGRKRLRCIGHIINLVVRAIVFGSDVAKFEKDLRGASDEFSFQLWARNGAIGRLHNIVTYLRRSDQRRQELRRLQKDLAGDDNIFTLEVIADGKTRWNSVFLMIKRGK